MPAAALGSVLPALACQDQATAAYLHAPDCVRLRACGLVGECKLVRYTRFVKDMSSNAGHGVRLASRCEVHDVRAVRPLNGGRVTHCVWAVRNAQTYDAGRGARAARNVRTYDVGYGVRAGSLQAYDERCARAGRNASTRGALVE